MVIFGIRLICTPRKIFLVLLGKCPNPIVLYMVSNRLPIFSLRNSLMVLSMLPSFTMIIIITLIDSYHIEFVKKHLQRQFENVN